MEIRNYRNCITVILFFISLAAFGQTQPTLPAGTVPYSSNIFKDPNGNAWTGKAGSYMNLGSWSKIDSLFKTGYSKAQIDSIAVESRKRANHTGTQPQSTITGLQTSLDGKVDKSTTITGGAGITVGGSLATGAVSVEVNDTYLNGKYIRKDASDNNGANTLTVGKLVSPAVEAEALKLASLATGTGADEVLVVDATGAVKKKSAASDVNIGVANGAGTNQFFLGAQDAIRFVGSGDTDISFNNSTKTVTINSVPGAGGGGAVTSFNGRTGGVTSQAGDYSTDQVSEGTNKYFTDARTRAAVLSGFNPASTSPVVDTDNVLQALGKLQGQTNTKAASNRTLTVSGTAGRIVASGGAQDLTADREWTLDLAPSGIAAGAFTKIVVDSYGRAIGGGTLSTSDIPALPYRPDNWVPSIGDIPTLQTNLDSRALANGSNATGTWPIGISGTAAIANQWGSGNTIENSFTQQINGTMLGLGLDNKWHYVDKAAVLDFLDLSSGGIDTNNFVRTTGDQTINGKKSFLGPLAIDSWGSTTGGIQFIGGGRIYAAPSSRLAITTPDKLYLQGVSNGVQIDGSATVSSLAGTGARMVTANTEGVLSTAAIPDASNKANIDGSNATGTWPINVTGSANGWNGYFNNFSDPISNSTIDAIAGQYNNGQFYRFSPTAVRQFLGSPSGGETFRSILDRDNHYSNSVVSGTETIFTYGNSPTNSLAKLKGYNEFAANYGAGWIFSVNGRDNIGIDALALMPDGRVGIGTTNPSAKLDVNGNFKAISANGYINIDNVGSGENYYNANSFHQFQINEVAKVDIVNTGLVVHGDISATGGNSYQWNEAYNNRLEKESQISADNLDTAPLGRRYVVPGMVGIPVQSSQYGELTTTLVSSWRYQIFRDTEGATFSRMNINASGWTGWNKHWTTGDFSQTNINQWNSAYSWGPHAGVYVGLSGHQTIYDTKTFTSSPKVPTPSVGADAVNKDYVDALVGGGGTSKTRQVFIQDFNTGSETKYVEIEGNEMYVVLTSASNNLEVGFYKPYYDNSGWYHYAGKLTQVNTGTQSNAGGSGFDEMLDYWATVNSGAGSGVEFNGVLSHYNDLKSTVTVTVVPFNSFGSVPTGYLVTVTSQKID